jgi:hypothetical protein
LEVPVTVGSGGLTQLVKVQRVFTLTRVTGQKATISLKSVILTPVNDPQIEAQLVQRTPTGTLEFDLQQGLFLSQELTAEKSVLNAFGGQSALQATSITQERLIPAAAAVEPASAEKSTP